MLAERRRLGIDKSDEMWEGVLHLVPPASERHQSLEAELVVALRPAARRHGWKVTTNTGVFASDDDYRVADVVVFSREAASHRGVDGAPEVVIEVRSSHDETYEKVPWYLARGAKRSWSSTATPLHFSCTLRMASSGRARWVVADRTARCADRPQRKRARR